jgi:hypothetical protein
LRDRDLHRGAFGGAAHQQTNRVHGRGAAGGDGRQCYLSLIEYVASFFFTGLNFGMT